MADDFCPLLLIMSGWYRCRGYPPTGSAGFWSGDPSGESGQSVRRVNTVQQEPTTGRRFDSIASCHSYRTGFLTLIDFSHLSSHRRLGAGAVAIQEDHSHAPGAYEHIFVLNGNEQLNSLSVESIQGYMGFESRGQGLGSTFFLELPLYSATTAGVCPNAGVYPTASMNAPVGHRLSHSPNSTVDTIVDRQALGGGAIDEEDMRPIIVNHLLPTSGDDSSGEY